MAQVPVPEENMISSLTITFNGEPTIRACLENLIPVVDRAVVVEGAIDAFQWKTRDGHSTDRTNSILDELSSKHDNVVVVRSPVGFWPSKEEMVDYGLNSIAPGVLWQVDDDEFWFQNRMRMCSEWMLQNEDCTAMEFWGRQFFGGFTKHAVLRDGEWGNDPPWRRCFRYDGSRWISHRPPRLASRSPEKVMSREETMSRFGAAMFHYGYCWRKQVVEKLVYYNHQQEQQVGLLEAFDRIQAGLGQDAVRLEPYLGRHPVRVDALL